MRRLPPPLILLSNAGRLDGQLEDESGTLALFALDPDAASVCQHSRAAEGQADAEAARAVASSLDAGKLFEDPLLLGGRDAGALVLHPEPD